MSASPIFPAPRIATVSPIPTIVPRPRHASHGLWSGGACGERHDLAAAERHGARRRLPYRSLGLLGNDAAEAREHDVDGVVGGDDVRKVTRVVRIDVERSR